MTQNVIGERRESEGPCLAFLIPFAPRRAKAKWGIACSQLLQTLASIKNSQCGDYYVVVAGNELPDFRGKWDSRFDFVSLEQAPVAHAHPVAAGVLDKMAKINAAWDRAKTRCNPRYVMKLDADDFVSCDLVGWLANQGTAPGYLISLGWFWEDGERHLIESTESLDRVCGSCLIIRSDMVERTGPFRTASEGVVFSEENARFAEKDQYSLVPGSETSTLLANDSHQRWAAQLAYLGHKIEPVPFRAVVYRRGNPDSNNWAGGTYGLRRRFYTFRMLLGSICRQRLITHRIRSEFMLP